MAKRKIPVTKHFNPRLLDVLEEEQHDLVTLEVELIHAVKGYYSKAVIPAIDRHNGAISGLNSQGGRRQKVRKIGTNIY